MIKFFIKIRQNLLMENKTGKYFKYAIGEIVLVVIGILIALSINNWNEKQLQHSKDFEFLESLKSELVIDTISLSTKIRNYTGLNNELNITLVSLDTIVNINGEHYQKIIDELGYMETLTPVGKNLQKNDIALANGTLSRIDQSLNDRFLEYLEITKSNNEIISKLGITLQQVSIQYLTPTIDMQKDTISTNFQTEFNNFRYNRSIRNSLVKSIRYRNIHLTRMKAQLKNANGLIVSIDSLLINSKK
jgi:hypothetical protein